MRTRRTSVGVFAVSVLGAVGVMIACGEQLPASDTGGDTSTDGAAATADGATDAGGGDLEPAPEEILPTPPDAAPEVVVVIDDAGAPDVVVAADGGSTCAPDETTLRLGPQSAQAKSGTASTFTAVGKSAYWGAVAELGMGDDDKTFIRCEDNGGELEWIRLDHDDAPSLSGRRITRVTVFVRARKEGAGEAVGAFGVFAGTKAYVGAKESLAATYQLYARPFSSHPVSGTAWTRNQLDDFEFYLACGADDVKNGIRLTQVWAEVCHKAN